jgi:HPt (histidine-containing phosphotransfer) domain-containing protein
MAFERLSRKRPDLRLSLASSIAEAAEKLGSETFDLLITDRFLSDGTARDVIALRGDLPLLLTSGSEADDLLAEYPEELLGYLPKPITGAALQAALDQLSAAELMAFEPDLTYLNELAGGDEAFRKEMLEIFLAEVPPALEKIPSLLEAEAWQELFATVHNLRSKLRILGLKDLNDLANQIEQDCKTGNTGPHTHEQAQGLIAALRGGIPRVKEMC